MKAQYEEKLRAKDAEKLSLEGQLRVANMNAADGGGPTRASDGPTAAAKRMLLALHDEVSNLQEALVERLPEDATADQRAVFLSKKSS